MIVGHTAFAIYEQVVSAKLIDFLPTPSFDVDSISLVCTCIQRRSSMCLTNQGSVVFPDIAYNRAPSLSPGLEVSVDNPEEGHVSIVASYSL